MNVEDLPDADRFDIHAAINVALQGRTIKEATASTGPGDSLPIVTPPASAIIVSCRGQGSCIHIGPQRAHEGTGWPSPSYYEVGGEGQESGVKAGSFSRPVLREKCEESGTVEA